MRWLWQKVLWPVIRFTAQSLLSVFKWAFYNPVAAGATGLAIVGLSCLIGHEETASAIAAFGWALFTTAVTGYVLPHLLPNTARSAAEWGTVFTNPAGAPVKLLQDLVRWVF
jgi:hypothetical protein